MKSEKMKRCVRNANYIPLADPNLRIAVTDNRSGWKVQFLSN